MILGQIDRTLRFAAGAGLVMVVSTLGSTAAAHHSRVEYVGGEIHEVEGEVVRLVWRNPHVMIVVRETQPDGSTVDWILEGPGAGTAARDGVRGANVAVGDHVRAAGNRSDRRDTWLRLANVLGPDGTELVLTSSGPRWSEDFLGRGQEPETEAVAGQGASDGIFRVWVYTDPTPYVIDELPPLNAEAMAAYEAYDPLRDDPALECDMPGMPRIMTITGTRPFEFVRRGDDIGINAQNFNGRRLIHMDGAPVPANVEATPTGYSTGRWEGGTLVVRTTHISYPFFDLPPWWGVPQTEAMELVERFTLEGDVLYYDFWANDPTLFTQPIDKPRVLRWHSEPGLSVEQDTCVPYYAEE
jgi:hypothetical protein